MSDKSDTPTHEMARLIDEVASLSRELAEARAERNAAIARSMSNAMEAQAHEDRARMAEAECERLRDTLQVCLSYWLSDANPDELQGSVAHMKHISGFAAAIDAARRK